MGVFTVHCTKQLRRIVNATGGECYQIDDIAEGFNLLESETVVSLYARRGGAAKPRYSPRSQVLLLAALAEKEVSKRAQSAHLPMALSKAKVVPPARLPGIDCFASEEQLPNLRSSMPPSATRRILHELRQIAAGDGGVWLCGGDGVHVFPAEARCDFWRVLIEGPPSSPFAGGVFSLTVQLPHNYPEAPPNVRFETPVYQYARTTLQTTGVIMCCW